MTVVSHQIKQHSNVHCSQANCIYDLWPLCFHSSYWLSTKFAVEHGLSFCFILALLLFLLFSGECNAVRSASFFLSCSPSDLWVSHFVLFFFFHRRILLLCFWVLQRNRSNTEQLRKEALLSLSSAFAAWFS